MAQNSRVPVRRLDYALVALFVMLWLVPVTYSGIGYRPARILPDYFRYLGRIACLFHTSTRYWSNFYVQVRIEGTDAWLTPPPEEFSAMRPVAHRTRLAWALARSTDDPRGELQRQRIAEFVKTRFEREYPDSPAVVGVRFLRLLYKTGEEPLVRPDGPWATPSLDRVEPGRGLVVSTHDFGPGDP